MQVSSRKLHTLHITDAEGIDGVLVALLEWSDTGTYRCTLTVGSASNTAAWGKLPDGMQSFHQFLETKDIAALVGQFDLFGAMHRKVDHLTFTSMLKDDLAERLGDGSITEQTFLELGSQIEMMVPITDINGVVVMHNSTMTDIYGPLWANEQQHRILGKSAAFKGLIRRVEVLKEALSALRPQ